MPPTAARATSSDSAASNCHAWREDAAWAAWFNALHPDTSARWTDAYTNDAGLAAVHNTTAFANAIYVSAAETQDPQIKRLAPLAIALLKALP